MKWWVEILLNEGWTGVRSFRWRWMAKSHETTVRHAARLITGKIVMTRVVK